MSIVIQSPLKFCALYFVSCRFVNDVVIADANALLAFLLWILGPSFRSTVQITLETNTVFFFCTAIKKRVAMTTFDDDQASPSEASRARQESLIVMVEEPFQVPEREEMKEEVLRGADSDGEFEITFVPANSGENTLDGAIDKMERSDFMGDDTPNAHYREAATLDFGTNENINGSQSLAGSTGAQKSADSKLGSDHADEENLSMFSILFVFGVALSCVCAFLPIGVIKNWSIESALSFAFFGTVPVIALALVSIRAYNKRKDKNHRKGNDAPADVWNKEFYPKDTYSFIALCSPYHNFKFFFFGLIVWMFQLSLLLLMALNVIVPRLRTTGEVDNTESGEWIGNDIFPSTSGYLVRTTQVISLMVFIFFPGETLMDVSKAVRFFPSANKGEVEQWDVHGLRLSCSLRLLQGLLSTLAVWLLVMTASDVVDIILNFTAINFISNLDDKAFELAKSGNYGKSLEKAANRINKKELPVCVNTHSKITLTPTLTPNYS